jgi:SAM-dependent MidA family methyltransferase
VSDVTTPLGMPALPPRTEAPPWRTAWDQALYGPGGFFRRHSPADHFRTSAHDSDLLARALLRLLRAKDLDTVVDVGAGRGELLVALHALDPTLRLLGVEVAPRPAELPTAVDWTAVLPSEVDGLVFANEWLDDIPCHVAQMDTDDSVRVVHVDPATGEESLGHRVDLDGVPGSLVEWLDRWWPLTHPGDRAEIGTTRDRAWADVVSRLTRGLAIAVDYGHLIGDRPRDGSLRSYLAGREVPVLPDGSRDVTAHVAVDAVAAVCDGVVLRQREALATLGITAERPPLPLAGTDPTAYAVALERATRAADLLAPGGLGDFYWVVSGAGGVEPSLS